MIRAQITYSFAPSIMADSLSSSGTPMKACLIRKIEETLTSPLKTNGHIVPTSPMSLNMENRGISVSWPGIISWARYTKNSAWLPLNFSLAKA